MWVTLNNRDNISSWVIGKLYLYLILAYVPVFMSPNDNMIRLKENYELYKYIKKKRSRELYQLQLDKKIGCRFLNTCKSAQKNQH